MREENRQPAVRPAVCAAGSVCSTCDAYVSVLESRDDDETAWTHTMVATVDVTMAVARQSVVDPTR
jgi:hypothetical protein